MGLFGRFRGQMDDDERARRAVEAERAGLARLQDGNLRQAEADLRRAVVLSPDNPALHGHLGMALHRLGRAEEANKELQNAINLGPMDDMLRHLHGQILESLLRLDEAAEEYRVACSLNPRSSRNAAALGALELRRDNQGAAEGHIRKALEMDPNEPHALVALAAIRQRGGDLRGAIEAMQRARATRNDHPEDYYRMGILLEEAGDLDRAIDELRSAQQGLPGDIGALQALGRVLLKRGRKADAQALYERVIRADPGNRTSYEQDLGRLKAQYGGEPAAPPVQDLPRVRMPESASVAPVAKPRPAALQRLVGGSSLTRLGEDAPLHKDTPPRPSSGSPLAAPGPILRMPPPPLPVSGDDAADKLPPSHVERVPDLPAHELRAAAPAAPTPPASPQGPLGAEPPAPHAGPGPRPRTIGGEEESDDRESPAVAAVAPRRVASPGPPASPAAGDLARLEAAVAAEPNNSRLHRDLSILYLRAGRLADAREQARLAELVRAQRGVG